MKSGLNKRKHGAEIKESLFERLQFPAEMVGRESFIYYRIGGELCIYGCREIIKYENEEIKLRTVKNGKNVSIFGNGLTMKTYYQKDMIISGDIIDIKIE